jgi:O-antigen/teichoic acid export membrane protein
LKFFKNNILFKVLSLNSISVAINFLLGLISVKIISIYLGASGMAIIGSFRNFTSIFKSVSTIGINNSIIKLFVENKEDKKELNIIFSTFFWIFLTISTSLAIFGTLFSKVISQFLFYSESYTIPIQIFSIILPLIVINVFWLAIFNGLGEFKKIVAIQIISNILIFCLSTILILYQNVFGALLAIAFSEVLMLIITYLFIKKDCPFFTFNLKKVISNKYINIIKKFALMALLSGIIVPLISILIRNEIIVTNGIVEAGIWDATLRISAYYMMFFSSGLTLYYLPKLASLKTDLEFKNELISYFKLFVPIFLVMIIFIYIFKSYIIHLIFSPEFQSLNSLLKWQLLGDFIKVLTLAFGYQIVVKTMLKLYFFGEIFYNLMYYLLTIYLIKENNIEGAVQAYFYTNLIYFIFILFMFRKLFFIKEKLYFK